MKYRHAFHAGNFADVHKHVTLLALLGAMQRKDKGLLFVDTHAGRGLYDLGGADAGKAGEWRDGVGRLVTAARGCAPRERSSIPEIDAYVDLLDRLRAAHGGRCYPGSPLIAAQTLRAQDRGIAFELDAGELAALERVLPAESRLRAEQADGFERLRALLPPRERRGLVLIDPPYEDTRQDFARTLAALEDALRRFATGVTVVWYPIKDAHELARWHSQVEARIGRPLLFAELRLYAADSRASLNGSGLLIVNPPYLVEERMRVWLPALYERLAIDPGGGASMRAHAPAGSAA